MMHTLQSDTGRGVDDPHPASAERLTHGEYGVKQSYSHKPNGDGYNDDHSRAEQGDSLIDLPVGAALDGVGDLGEDFLELIALLGDGDHLEDLEGDEATLAEGLGQGLAGTDVFGGLLDGGGEGAVAG